jgi:hypothetical protein
MSWFPVSSRCLSCHDLMAMGVVIPAMTILASKSAFSSHCTALESWGRLVCR